MPTAIENIPVRTIDGQAASLADHAGKVRLIVNVASRCGFTPQYTGLEALYRRFHDRGFEILGFPANEFGAQEPGSDEEIKAFCSTTYDVTFPLFSKIVVKGPGQHPLYAALTRAAPHVGQATPSDAAAANAEDISWNFEKFLINRRGEVVARFSPRTKPDAPELVSAIERELSAAAS